MKHSYEEGSCSMQDGRWTMDLPWRHARTVSFGHGLWHAAPVQPPGSTLLMSSVLQTIPGLLLQSALELEEFLEVFRRARDERILNAAPWFFGPPARLTEPRLHVDSPTAWSISLGGLEAEGSLDAFIYSASMDAGTQAGDDLSWVLHCYEVSGPGFEPVRSFFAHCPRERICIQERDDIENRILLRSGPRRWSPQGFLFTQEKSGAPV